MAKGLWINVAPQERSLVKFHLSEFRIWKEFSPWPTLVAFQKINLQGRNKLIVLSMSANEFTEVPHTIWCIIPQGIVC